MDKKTNILDTDYKNLTLRLGKYDEGLSKIRHFLNNYTDMENQSIMLNKYNSNIYDIRQKLIKEQEMLRGYVLNTLENSEILRNEGLTNISSKTLSDFDKVINDKKSINHSTNEHKEQIILSKEKNSGILFFKLIGMFLIAISFYIIR
jgi:hypothetical protein